MIMYWLEADFMQVSGRTRQRNVEKPVWLWKNAIISAEMCIARMWRGFMCIVTEHTSSIPATARCGIM